jgi:DMSO/TMAO reductase YedYZ molybdopterin-dependent catalytic subunit
MKRGMIVRQSEPLCLETPVARLADPVIDVDAFFVRNHFPTPAIDADAFRLAVEGAVERPLALSLAEIAALPRVDMEAVVECAGNGRVRYRPPRPGLQWENGGVGNAVWSGVRLSTVLERAGLREDACEVVLIGADAGHVDGGQKTASPGPIAFARSIPLSAALSDAVILATHMNGAPLTPDHGFPLRAVVGGWYGMAWIKWLVEVRVVAKPFAGYWQARDYFRWERVGGAPTMVPLTKMEPRAVIATPGEGDVVAAGAEVVVTGSAWSGYAAIAAVEIEAGDGVWRSAELLGEATAYGWRRFRHVVRAPASGEIALRARAVDAAGNRQPEEPQPDRESYGANWIVPVRLRIER